MRRREFLASTTIGAAAALLAKSGCAADRPSRSDDPPTVDPPTWVEEAINGGWQVGTWAAISGPSPSHGLAATNNMVDCRPTRGAKSLNQGFFKAWRGVISMPGHRGHGTLFTGPGGSHNTYGDGDGYIFDIGSRHWEQAWGPRDTTNTKVIYESGDIWYPDGAPYGEYIDGTPILNHQTGWHYYNPDTNEYVKVKGFGSPGSGSTSYPVYTGHALDLSAFDAEGFAVDQWRRSKDMRQDMELSTEQLNALSQIRHGTYDPVSKAFWVIANASARGCVIAYRRGSDQWTYYGPANGWWNGDDCAAVDPVRHVLVYVAPGIGAENNYTAVLDIGDGGANAMKRGPSGRFWVPRVSGSIPTAPVNSPGLAWSTHHDGVLYFQTQPVDNNSAVLLGKYAGPDRPSFAEGGETDYELHWSLLTSSANQVVIPMLESDGVTVGPGGGGTGVYGGFGVHRWGNYEVAFFAPGANEPVYAFRVA